MEKYRKFSDPATSCNPFLPLSLVRPRTESQGLRALRICVMSILFFLRIPLLSATVLLIGICDLLVMIPFVSTLIVVPIIRPFISTLALISLGVYPSIHASIADSRRLRIKRGILPRIKSSLVVSSFHGFIDILAHSITTRPAAFIFQTLDGNLVACRSLLAAIYTAIHSPLRKPGDSCDLPLANDALIFVSPSPTNGEGFLRMNSSLVQTACKGHLVKLASLEYKAFGPQDPHHLTDHWLTHVLKLSLNWGCTARVFICPELISVSSDEEVVQAKSLLARLYNPIAAETDLDASSIVEFREYWNNTHRGSYAKSK